MKQDLREKRMASNGGEISIQKTYPPSGMLKRGSIRASNQ